MATDLEERVRRMLQERATDVTPDPHTWQVVRDRVGQRRARLRVALSGVAAAVVACALVVVPALRQGPDVRFERSPRPPSTLTAPASEPPAAPAPATAPVPRRATTPPRLLVSDGASILLASAEGAVMETLWRGDESLHCGDGACDDQSFITSLAVRPGSTVTDLTVAYQFSDCGGLSWGTASGDVGDRLLGGGGLATPADSCPRGGTFSPDGGAFAWIGEEPRGSGRFVLHLQRWTDDGPAAEVAEDEGPGTGAVAAAVPLEMAGWNDVRVEDWSWTAAPGGAGRQGAVLVSATVGDERRVFAVGVAQAADGTFEVDPAPVPMEGRADGVPVAVAGTATLEVPVDGSGAPTLAIAAGTAASAPVIASLPLPPDVLASERVPWIAASAGAVVVGDGASRTWITREVDGRWITPTEVPGPVTAGAPLPPALGADADVPTPDPLLEPEVGPPPADPDAPPADRG